MEFKIINTPLGEMILSAGENGLTGAWFIKEQKGLPSDLIIKSWLKSDSNIYLNQAQNQLEKYFHKRLKEFDIKIDISAGTLFQQNVWRALLKVPFGEFITYSQIAENAGNAKAVRAAASAIAANPISIINPCHRVLGKGNTLSGFGGGLWRKKALLENEGFICDKKVKNLKNQKIFSAAG